MKNELHKLFSKLYPFYFSFNQSWKIQNAGPSLLKHFPEAIGKDFEQEFTLISPDNIRENTDQSKLEGILVVVRKENSSLIFQGQFIKIDDDLFYFGTPWINKSSDLTDNNIALTDFSLSDNTIDLLHLIQLLEKSNRELKEITNQYNYKNQDLEFSERRLHKIINSTHDIIFEINADLIFSEAWVRNEKDLFLPKNKIIGRHVTQVFPDSFGEKIVLSIQQVLRLKETLDLEYRHPQNDDWFNAQFNYFEFNNEISVTVSIRNITEKKLQQLEMETSNARLSSLITNLNQGILLENEEHKIVLINKMFCSIFSIDQTPDSLVGANSIDSARQLALLFKHPQKFIARINEIVNKRELVLGEVLEMESGKIIERSYIPIYRNEEYQGHLWKYTDITERSKAQTVLQITKDKYESIIENMGLGFLEADKNDILVGTNKRMLEILNYKNESDVINKVTTQLLFPPQSQKFIKAENKRRKTGASNVYEVLMKRSDGSLVPVLVSGSPLFDIEKKIIGSIGILLDMSRQKEVEKQLKEQTKLALKSANAKQAFLSNMSHEIRTPLNAIASAATLLDKTDPSKKGIDYTEIIRNASASLLSIVNDILDLAKIENGKIEFEKRPFAIHEMMNSVFNQHKLLADKRDITFELEVSDDIPNYLIGDAFRVAQVMHNLVSNAIKFTEKGGVKINVSVSKIIGRKIQVNFEVIDTGIGVSKKYLKGLFEPFSQEDVSIIKKYGGTGLGLSISKELIELLGGELFVESKKKVGSKFYFSLPFLIADKQTSTEVKNKTFDKSRLAVSTLLLAEDNIVNQVLAEEMLKPYFKQIISFDRAKPLLEYLKENDADVILMDLQMPEMDGIKATKIIRNEMALRIPVIGFSANALTAQIKKAMQAGMDDYISKPYELDNLLEKISKQLNPYTGLRYYNRAGVLQRIGGDENIEKKVGAAFAQSIENKWQQLIDRFVEKNHKAYRLMVHDVTPSVVMFVAPDYLSAFTEMMAKSKGNFSTVTYEQLSSFRTILLATVAEMKPFIS